MALAATPFARAQSSAQARDEAGVSQGEIQVALVREHIAFLAADELGGRGNGSEGLEKAAQYIARQFEALGLVPAGDDGGFFQPFEIGLGNRLGGRSRMAFRASHLEQTLEARSDFEPMTFTPAADLRAPIVFAGYGITAPEHRYDDYEEITVEGKIVLVLRYTPRGSRREGPFDSDRGHATFVAKAENARNHGAVAVMIVNGPLDVAKDELIPFGTNVGAVSLGIPTMHVRRRFVDQLLRSQGTSLRELQSSIDEELRPRSFELRGVEVELNIDVIRSQVRVSNVLGYLPPAPAPPSARRRWLAALELAGEHVIIGGHYDHLGLGERGTRDRRARGTIHNGADDNASGIAGMLELARLFARLERRPRGIIFAAFAGEEMGLQGSRHYVSSPPIPLENAVAMVNLDMIGRLRHNRLYVGGAGFVPGLSDELEDLADLETLSISYGYPSAGSSDHAPFMREGIPALFFFTGLHGDYHKPSDDPQFINADGMARVLGLTYEVSSYLLRLETSSVAGYPSRGRGRANSNGRDDAYFGIAIDRAFGGDGVRLSDVTDDGPAARAGLRPGDVIIELGGRTIGSVDRAAAIIREYRPGDKVRAKVRRKDRVVEVQVEFSRWP